MTQDTNKEINMEAVKVEFGKLVSLYSNMDDIKEDIKVVKEALKLEGVDAALLCKIAQAVVKDKKDDLASSASELIDLIAAVS